MPRDVKSIENLDAPSAARVLDALDEPLGQDCLIYCVPPLRLECSAAVNKGVTMRYACVLGLLISALGFAAPVHSTAQRHSDVRPQVIFWPQAPANPSPPTPAGLLYTPEVLAALAAASPDAVSPRIARATREQTPIVVLWTNPRSPNSDRSQGPSPR